MERKIENLEPENLWQRFVELSQIPRRPGMEAEARAWVLAHARKLGLDHQIDWAGNIVVRKGPGPGREEGPITILQSHIDMVCVAEKGSRHDFARDPLDLIMEDGFVTAKGTSLGADNGIGVATMMALMEDDSLNAGPLELLFTVEEETGLTGAMKMDPDLVKGRRLINTDTAEEGTAYVGCSGGLDIISTLEYAGESPAPGSRLLSLRVGGLTGGHSGLDIHRKRANAIKLIAGLLKEVNLTIPFSLISIEGGDKKNVIPREAEALIAVSERDAGLLGEIVYRYSVSVREEFEDDPDLLFTLEASEATDTKGLNRASIGQLIDFIMNAPHGPQANSRDFPDVVDISTNLATIRTENQRVVVGMNARSPRDREMDRTAEAVTSMGLPLEWSTRTADRYPGWQPDLDSHLLKTARRVYREAFDKEMRVTITHSGLECGVIRRKIPGMEIISLGSDIRDLHSPAERVGIGSVKRLMHLLRAVLEAL